MSTTYDEEPNPIEEGVQRVYTEIREWIDVILTSSANMTAAKRQLILTQLDDAISNGWDELMKSFWLGVKHDIDLL
jgi:hypothetical protein